MTYTQIILIIRMAHLENPLKHVLNPSLNMLNFPCISTGITFVSILWMWLNVLTWYQLHFFLTLTTAWCQTHLFYTEHLLCLNWRELALKMPEFQVGFCPVLPACYILVTCWDQREEETTDPYFHISPTTAKACVPFSKSVFWWQLLVLTCSQSIHTEWEASSAARILSNDTVCIYVCVCVLVINSQYARARLPPVMEPHLYGQLPTAKKSEMLHVNRLSKWFCHSTYSVVFGDADTLHWGVPVSFSSGDGGF